MGKLRIVSWNCHYGFEHGDSKGKKDAVKGLLAKADILILQEFTESDFKSLGYSSERSDWYGDNQDAFGHEPLGDAVFSKEGFTLARDYNGEEKFRYVLPYKFSRLPDGQTLTLFAVWTKKEPYYYEKNLFEALNHYKPSDRNTIVIGDYNVGACDAYPERFKELKEKMDGVGLVNCAKSEEQGKPTSVWLKDKYQNDYCFASSNLAGNAVLKVMDDDPVQNLSDHYPIIVDYDF
jgi:endonuclease/exonuclease/phosphatase family metal-dependent hydrolase